MSDTNPFKLFADWFAEAKASEPNDPDAMALATATPEGRPSMRMVLLKSYGPAGFTFHTNFDSRKGAELAANDRAALLFHWKSLRRQIRIEGPVQTVADPDSDAYFATRSRESQLAAWASYQSRPLDARATLESRHEDMSRRFEGDVPRPPRWGGFRLRPELFEFWIDRPHRLHERRLFSAAGDSWRESLLYP